MGWFKKKSTPQPVAAPTSAGSAAAKATAYTKKFTGTPTSSALPCPDDKELSALPAEAIPLLAAGFDPASFNTSFTLQKSSSGVYHDKRQGVYGTSTVSFDTLISSKFCVCVNGMLVTDPLIDSFFDHAEFVRRFNLSLKKISKNTSLRLDHLTTYDTDVVEEFDGEPAMYIPVVESLRTQISEAIRVTADQLKSSDMLASMYKDVCKESLLAQAYEATPEDPIFLSADDSKVLLGEEYESVDDFIDILLSAWLKKDTVRERRTAVFLAAKREMEEGFTPESLNFVPSTVPPEGERIFAWLNVERNKARERILDGIIHCWEETYAVPLEDVTPGAGAALVWFSPDLHISLEDDSVRGVLFATRLKKVSVSLVPAHVGRLVALDHPEEVAFLKDGDTERVLETALGVWDPASDGKLASLKEAVNAARLLG